MIAQPLKPSGQRRVGTGFETGEETRRESAMPKQDANANKSYFGPGGLVKGAGSGRHKTGLDVNGPRPALAGLQRSRTRRK